MDIYSSPLPPPPDCKVAWRGGCRMPAHWGRAGGMLDIAAVHSVLRAAGLPRAELLHMGWQDRYLDGPPPARLPERTVALLLGRLVLDDAYTDTGLCWGGTPEERRTAQRLGEKLIAVHWT